MTALIAALILFVSSLLKRKFEQMNLRGSRWAWFNQLGHPSHRWSRSKAGFFKQENLDVRNRSSCRRAAAR